MRRNGAGRRTALVIIVTAWLISVGGPAWAQGEGAVHGRIVAAADDSGLPHAVVTLRSVSTGETEQATADAAGRFVFAGVKADRFAIVASAEGFLPREVRLTVEPREIRGLTLSLDVAGLDVRVEVTAGESLPSTHSPSSTTLTADRVDLLPPFQRTGLADAIVTTAPGMIRGHDDFVHVRGHEIALNPSINGVSFWENPHAVFSAGLSPDVIDVANVMTGGFSAEYLNYALGRVNFYNHVTGGFVTEADHLTATNRFIAPMDQTHTLTAGATYRHSRTGFWTGTAMEYGSGTPIGHGAADHSHAEGEGDHEHAESAGTALRVPGHFTASFSAGIDMLRNGGQRSRLSLRFDVENITNNTYLIAQEGEFSPSQYSIPRLISLTARVRF